MLSIESQKAEMERYATAHEDVEIAEVFTEAMSAKAPGRPVFDEMIRRIEHGDAEGILAWHPDRLARNSVDGGKVIYLLDCGKLKGLAFATFSFENNSQGKFMLSITFGYSKYYVDSLSENVKRGLRARVERGWHPHRAPIGYLNDKETGTVVVDLERYHMVERIWRSVLTGSTVREVWRMARDSLGLRTPKRKRSGGRPVSLSGIYRILGNPFYAGVIDWHGKLYPGKHKRMISLDEFEMVKKQLGRKHQRRPEKNRFAFTGMIRCGECGYSVTAEHTRNRHGTLYTYYHCSKRSPDYRCAQRSIQAKELERQIASFLKEITLPEGLVGWALERLEHSDEQVQEAREKERLAVEKALSTVERQRANLTKMRLKDQVSDEEFERERRELEREKLRLAQELEEEGHEWLEPARELVRFNSRAVESLRGGSIDAKRKILVMTGSNPVLKDKILSIEAAKPFQRLASNPTRPVLRAYLNEVRTFLAGKEGHLLMKQIRQFNSLE